MLENSSDVSVTDNESSYEGQIIKVINDSDGSQNDALFLIRNNNNNEFQYLSGDKIKVK